MRLVLGMILGIALTVGATYVHDAGFASNTTASPAAERPMVNWDVVGENWRAMSAKMREQINKLTT